MFRCKTEGDDTQGKQEIVGLRLSFSKCDIPWEKTAEGMCGISPRRNSQVAIVSGGHKW